MKIQELRIGNWINHELGKCQVRGTTKNGIWLNDMGGPILLDGFMNIQPIPLTEDILLKCGFEEGIENNYLLGLVRVWHEKMYNRWFFFFDRSCRLELFGLHDLQNAYYYTHDKTELEVNL